MHYELVGLACIAILSCPLASAHLHARRAAAAATPSSRFCFQGPLAPVVMVSGAGASGPVPWRCAINSFAGDEDVPQARRGRLARLAGSGSAASCACMCSTASALVFTTQPYPALQWVADCVLAGQYSVGRELKMAFQLLPLPVRGGDGGRRGTGAATSVPAAG